MGNTLLDELLLAVQNESSISHLDKCSIQFFCKHLPAEVVEYLSQPASDYDCSKDYITDHFSNALAEAFIKHDIVTQKDIENFFDRVSFSFEDDTVHYGFMNIDSKYKQSEPICLFRPCLRDEICYRYAKVYPVLNGVVEHKLLHLDKHSFIDFFDDVEVMYDCCVKTVLRKMTDDQLSKLYHKLFE